MTGPSFEVCDGPRSGAQFEHPGARGWGLRSPAVILQRPPACFIESRHLKATRAHLGDEIDSERGQVYLLTAFVAMMAVTPRRIVLAEH